MDKALRYDAALKTLQDVRDELAVQGVFDHPGRDETATVVEETIERLMALRRKQIPLEVRRDLEREIGQLSNEASQLAEEVRSLGHNVEIPHGHDVLLVRQLNEQRRSKERRIVAIQKELARIG